MGKALLDEKTYRYILYFLETDPLQSRLKEVLTHSVMYVYDDPFGTFYDAQSIELFVDPAIYREHHLFIPLYYKSIKSLMFRLQKIAINEVRAFPDLDKFRVLENRIVSIVTPWEEVNALQVKLISQLNNSNATIDFQNVGNTARTLIRRICDIVFDSDIHKADSVSLDDPNKVKNRLETFIRVELAGSSDKPLRDFAITQINAVISAIDVSNNLTHDLNADSLLGEACVICTLSLINIIKLINSRKKF